MVKISFYFAKKLRVFMEFLKKIKIEIIGFFIGFLVGTLVGIDSGLLRASTQGLIGGISLLGLLHILLHFHSRKLTYAIIGFFIGAPSLLILAPGLGYAFYYGFELLPFLLLIISPALVGATLLYSIASITNTKTRRIVVGIFVSLILLFLAFYLPVIF